MKTRKLANKIKVFVTISTLLSVIIIKPALSGDLSLASYYQSYSNYYAAYSGYYGNLAFYEQYFNSNYNLGETYVYYSYLNMSSAKEYANVAQNYAFSAYISDPTSTKYTAYINAYYDYYYKLYASYYLLYAFNDFWNESSNYGQSHVYNAIMYSFYGNYYNGFANNNCGTLSFGGIY